jgi:hypothetical protein
MADEIKNVFISHVHEDDAGLSKLKDLIAKGGLTVRDSSINKTNPNDAKDPDYIKTEILSPQIQWASTLLVYITPKTKGSEWVNWEIEYAEKQGKRIVGVYAQGSNDCDVPEALEKYADDVRGWQSDGMLGDWGGPVTRVYGLTEKFDIEGVPMESARRATFLIDKSGTIIHEQVGDAAVDPSKTVEACERHKLKN